MTTSLSEPLAYLILDRDGRMVDSGGPVDQSRLQSRALTHWQPLPAPPEESAHV